MKPSERANAEILAEMKVLPEQAGQGEADIYERIEDAIHARQRVQIEESRFAADVFSLFNGAVGQKVAERLRRDFVERELFDSDPINMARRVAEHDFVVRLLSLAEAGYRAETANLESKNDGRA